MTEKNDRFPHMILLFPWGLILLASIGRYLGHILEPMPWLAPIALGAYVQLLFLFGGWVIQAEFSYLMATALFIPISLGKFSDLTPFTYFAIESLSYLGTMGVMALRDLAVWGHIRRTGYFLISNAILVVVLVTEYCFLRRPSVMWQTGSAETPSEVFRGIAEFFLAWISTNQGNPLIYLLLMLSAILLVVGFILGARDNKSSVPDPCNAHPLQLGLRRFFFVIGLAAVLFLGIQGAVWIVNGIGADDVFAIGGLVDGIFFSVSAFLAAFYLIPAWEASWAAYSRSRSVARRVTDGLSDGVEEILASMFYLGRYLMFYMFVLCCLYLTAYSIAVFFGIGGSNPNAPWRDYAVSALVLLMGAGGLLIGLPIMWYVIQSSGFLPRRIKESRMSREAPGHAILRSLFGYLLSIGVIAGAEWALEAHGFPILVRGLAFAWEGMVVVSFAAALFFWASHWLSEQYIGHGASAALGMLFVTMGAILVFREPLLRATQDLVQESGHFNWALRTLSAPGFYSSILGVLFLAKGLHLLLSTTPRTERADD